MQRVAAAREARRKLAKLYARREVNRQFRRAVALDNRPRPPHPHWKTFAPSKAYPAKKPAATVTVTKTKKAGRPKGSKNKAKLPPLSPPLPGAKYTDKLRSADRKLGTRRKYYMLPY